MFDFFLALTLFLFCFSIASFLSVIFLKLCLDIINSDTYNLFHRPTLHNEYVASDYEAENDSDSDSECDNDCDGDCCKDVYVNETTSESSGSRSSEATNVSEHYKTD